MPDTIVLDPSELTTRTAIDITPWVSSDGIDWGDATIAATLAEQRAGATPVDFTVPPRQIQIPLSLREVGGTTFATVRSTLQAKIGLWQAQGGYLKRVLATGGTVFADITDASLRLGGGWLQSHRSADIDAALTLTAIPDFYKAEETLSDHTETTAPEIRFTETTVNGGDFPLGDRVRIVVDEDQGQNQRGCIWGWRAKHYSSAVTAASAYDAESLSPLDTAAVAAKGGAASGQVVTHSSLSTNWTPVVGTNIGGGTATAGTALTHTGTNRIFARVFTTSGTAVQSRFVWDVGDLVLPVENDAVRCYDGGTFHILDLGEVRLDQPANTTGYRWQGMIQAKGNSGGESFSVDRVWIVNADESSGVLRAPLTFSQGLSTFSARSEFNTESGAITGDSLVVGGVWASAGSSGDFSVNASTGKAERTATSDASGRRYALAGATTYTDIVVQIDVETGSAITAAQGVVLRYVDTSNSVLAEYFPSSGTFCVGAYVGGADVDRQFTLLAMPVGTPSTIRVMALANGYLAVWVDDVLVHSRFRSQLATGGTLASGQIGFHDWHTTATAVTRAYDNFAAWVPTPDAVAFASQSVELNTKGISREDVGGTAYGPVSQQYGDLPRMPNQSSAGTVEFFGKLSRGDIATLPDPNIDDISCRVFRRASYLTVG